MNLARTALVLFAFVLGGQVEGWAADPEQGKQLAVRWCAECHFVSEQQRQGSADVPSFAAIGRMPGFSVEKLVFFLLEPHPKMPNFPLSRAEAQDLAAYIAALPK
jgi:mono/diheme cytochrome c family protein